MSGSNPPTGGGPLGPDDGSGGERTRRAPLDEPADAEGGTDTMATVIDAEGAIRAESDHQDEAVELPASLLRTVHEYADDTATQPDDESPAAFGSDDGEPSGAAADPQEGEDRPDLLNTQIDYPDETPTRVGQVPLELLDTQRDYSEEGATDPTGDESSDDPAAPASSAQRGLDAPSAPPQSVEATEPHEHPLDPAELMATHFDAPSGMESPAADPLDRLLVRPADGATDEPAAKEHSGAVPFDSGEIVLVGSSSQRSEQVTVELPHQQVRRGVRRRPAATTGGPGPVEPAQVPAKWSKAVAGLRVEGARSSNNAIRARLLTVGAGLTWQLIGDHDDADHLLREAIEADPSLYWAHRERALMRLREGRDPVWTLTELAQGLRPRDRFDHRRRMRGRMLLLASVFSLARAKNAGDPGARALADELAQAAWEDLRGTPLAALWFAYRARDEQPSEFALRYLAAASECRSSGLRTAILTDLATGLWTGEYASPSDRPLNAAELGAEAASLSSETPLVSTVAEILASGDAAAEHDRLMGRVDELDDPGLIARAAGLAESLGRPDAALDVLERAGGVNGPFVVGYRTARLAVSAGRPELGREVIHRLRDRPQRPLGEAALALEEASLAALQGDRKGWAQAVADAFAHEADLATARLELGRHHLQSGAYRELMDLRASDLVPRASTRARRAEILESRLHSPVEAVAEYAEALREAPDDELSFRGLERLHAYGGQVDELFHLYSNRAEAGVAPDEQIHLLRMAAHLAIFERSAPQDAWPIVQRLATLAPADRNLRIERAELAFRLGHMAEACGLAETLMQDADPSVAALFAEDRLNRIDRPVPVELLTQALARAPDSALAWEHLEVACLQSADFGPILAQSSRYTQDESRDAQLFWAHALCQGGRSVEAVPQLERWVVDHPDDGAAHALLVGALLAAGLGELLHDRWAADALARFSTSPSVEGWLDWIGGQLSPDRAATVAESIASVHDRHLIWAATLAAARSPLVRVEAALRLAQADIHDTALQAAAEAIVSTSPDSTDRIRLYTAWAKRADEQRSRDYWLHQLADAYLAGQRPADALTIWSRLAKLRPSFLPARVGELMALEELGRTSEADSLAETLAAGLGSDTDPRTVALHKLVEAALPTSPESTAPLLRLELSELAVRAGLLERASEQAIYALEIAPDWPPAARQLVRLLARANSPGDMPEPWATRAAVVRALQAPSEDDSPPDPSLDPVWAGIRLGRVFGAEPAGWLESLAVWSECGDDPELALHADLAAARLAELELGRDDVALACYERAWTRRPEDLWIAGHVARLSRATGRLTPERRERLAGTMAQGAPAAPVLVHLAAGGDRTERAEILALALNLDPGYLPAEWALLALDRSQLPTDALARRGRRRGIARLIVEAAERRMASGQTQDLAEAESLLYEALRLSPDEVTASFGGPYDGLIGILRERGRSVELIALGEDLIGSVRNPVARRRLLESAVRVSLTSGATRSVARRAISQLLEMVPDDRVTIRRAIGLVAQVGEWDHVLELLKREKELLRQPMPALVPVVWWEMGEIIRIDRDSLDGALACYKKALDDHPTHPLIVSAISRALIETGGWDELAARMRALLEAESDPDKRAGLHINIAGIEEFHRLDARLALTHYLEALSLDPSDPSALLGVVRVGERADQVAAAGAAMEAAANLVPGELGEALLLRAAEVAEWVTRDSGAALELYEKLLGTSLSGAARAGIDACLLREGGVDALLEWRGDPALSTVIGALLKPGGVAEWPAAQEAPPAIQIGRIFRGPDDRDGSISRVAAGRLGQMLGDASVAADLIRLGLAVGTLRGAPVDNSLNRTLVQLDPADELGMLLLEADAEPGSDDERWAIEARIRVAPAGPRRADAMTALVRHHALRGEDDALWETLEQLKSEAPELPLFSHYRAALSTDSDDPQVAADRFEHEARTASSDTRAAELWLAAARLRRRQLGQVAHAVTALWTAMEADPTSVEAFNELRDLLVTHGDLEGLYRLFEMRFRHLDDRGAKVDILERMAELAYYRLDDRDRAAWCHREIVALDETRVRSYRILAEVLLAEGDFAHAAEMLEAVAAQASGEQLLTKTHLDLAELYRSKLNRRSEAETHYRAVLALHPDHAGALGGLAKLAEAGHRWAEAATVLRQLAERTGNRPRASGVYLRLAGALERLDDDQRTKELERALRRAVEIRPDNVEAITALAEYARRSGRTGPVELIVKQVADRFGTDEPAPGEKRALRLVFDLFHRMDWTRRADVVADVLRFLDYHTDQSERHRRDRERPEHPWRHLEPVPAERTASVFPPQLRLALINCLRTLDAPLTRAFPSRGKLMGASRRTRLSRTAQHPAVRVASALGRPDAEVYACLAPMSRPLLEPGTSGPMLLIARDFQESDADDPTLWALGNALAPAAMGFATLARLPAHAWLAAVVHIVRKVQPSYQESTLGAMLDLELQERIDSALTKRSLDACSADLKEVANLDWDALEVQHRLLQVAFARLAALVCIDLYAVLREVASSGPGPTCARAVVPFILGRDFHELQVAARMVDGHPKTGKPS